MRKLQALQFFGRASSVLALTFSGLTFSQEASVAVYQQAQRYFIGAERIQVDEHSQRPLLVEGRLAERVYLRDHNDARELMQTVAPFYGLNSERDQFRVKRSFVDEAGGEHARVQHLHRGVPVFGSEVYAHGNVNGTVTMINGQLVDALDINTTPILNAEQAVQVALQKIGPAKYRWEDAAQEASIKETYNDAQRTWRPQPELVIAPVRGDFAGRDYRLAWKMMIPVDAPQPANWIYFVDARTGEVMISFNKMHSVTGTGTSIYSGTVNIETNLNGSTYEMYDAGRKIKTYDANNAGSLPGTLLTDSDNVWDGTRQVAGVDVHWGTQWVYDYYLNIHGRNSFNNAGAQFTQSVHVNTNWVNASWNGSQVQFGDGNGVDSDELVAIDVAAHEWTHAVTDYESDLTYSGESGALNESLSDIFGETIQIYAKGLSTWQIGEECWTPGVSGDALRSMANPNAEGQPDTYGGTYWVNPSQWWNDNGGVHTNSGVSNFAYYLLVNGGSGTNDKGSAYSVTAIGLNDARAIFYLAQTTYLTSSSNFAAARTATENAASSLFGANSAQKLNVSRAWYAVGVGTNPDGGTGGGGNLALNKTATASSTSGSNVAGRAVDASTSTYWRSGSLSSTTNAWLRVDLGSAQSINRVVIKWRSSYYAKQYDIQVSSDNTTSPTNWTNVIVDNAGNGGTDDRTFTAVSARHVRINMRQNNTSSERINELEVYGGSGALGKDTPSDNALALVPAELALAQNYPNPFNPSTKISFSLPEAGRVSLKVFDVLGAEVATLMEEHREAGLHSVNFAPQNIPSGVYFYVLQVGETKLMKRLVFMK